MLKRPLPISGPITRVSRMVPIISETGTHDSSYDLMTRIIGCWVFER